QLKSALKDASNAAERSAYMNTYAMALKNPKLRNLAQSYFQTLQKLGKGNDAPNFIAKNLENNTVNLNDYKGQYVVIDVWATWCGPCLRESPYFERTAIKYKNDDTIVFIALSTDENKEKW